MIYELSVIICSHDPRPDYLERTLDGLANQTLETGRWELLVIDNASSPPIDPRRVSAKVPSARVVIEEELGLTPARLRGIRETTGEILVFVDDDNVLDPNYLAEALRLKTAHPALGAWGGSVVGEFGASVPSWMRDRLSVIAVREIRRESIRTDLQGGRGLPVGAGMVLSREVVDAYVKLLDREPIRRNLDRCGKSPLGGGDRDLARTALKERYASGLFPSLRLTHLIPASRLEKDYFLNLWKGGMAGTEIINRLDGITSSSSRGGWKQWVRRSLYWRKHQEARRLRREAKLIADEFFRTHEKLLEG